MNLREKAKERRKKGVSIIKIAKELGVSKSSVSTWTRDVAITEEQKRQLLSRPNTKSRAVAHSNFFKMKREGFQEKGREKIKQGEPLYVAGCMLYWGEGTKNINKCELVNSELPMLVLFKKFLETYFGVADEHISIWINAYTDIHSEDDIKKYWLNGLQLPESRLKYSLWNQYPSSSKKKNLRKSSYGTCSLSVNKTEIVQEIFGAIQEFGAFVNDSWLTKYSV